MEKEKKTPTKLYQTILSATCGGFISALTVTPLEVIKTRMQVQTKSFYHQLATFHDRMNHVGEMQQCKTCSGETQPVYRSSFDTASKIIKYEGITSLWRGLTPALMMQLPSTVFYYTLYDKTKIEFSKNEYTRNEFVPLFSGIIARSITTSITSPFDFIKTQIQSSTKNTSIKEIISTTIKENGLRSIWKGMSPTLLRDVPFSGLYWYLYEKNKLRIQNQSMNLNPFIINFLSGASSGMISAIVTNPIDVVKTRIQANLHKSDEYSSTIQSIKTIFKKDGFEGFFRGVVPRSARIAPASAIMISTFELSKSFFDEN
eukprot:gene7218-11534_t